MARRTDTLQIKLETDGAGQVKASLGGVESSAQKTGKAFRDMGNAADWSGRRFNMHQRTLTDWTGKFQNLGKEGKRSLNDINEKTNNLRRTSLRTGNAFQFLTGAIAAAGAASVIRGMVRAQTQLDAITGSLRVATGSSEAAAREMEFVSSEAERLGLALQPTAEAYASLAAAAKGTNLEGQASRDIFIGVSEAMTALGRPAADTERALLAIEQIISKGNVSAEELRGQLGEVLPGAFQIAARSLGVTTQELNKMLQQGEVLAEDLLPRMADELNNTFSDQATRNAGNLQAEINRLQTAVFELMSDQDMTGLRDAIVDITDTIKDPSFQQGFSSFTGGIITLTGWVADLAASFGDLGKNIGESLAQLAGYQTRGDAITGMAEALRKNTAGEKVFDPIRGREVEVANDSNFINFNGEMVPRDELEARLNRLRAGTPYSTYYQQRDVTAAALAAANEPPPEPSADSETTTRRNNQVSEEAQKQRNMLLEQERKIRMDLFEARQKSLEQQRELDKRQREALEDRVSNLQDSLKSETELEIERYQKSLDLLERAEEQKLATTMSYAELRKRLEQQTADRIREIEASSYEAVADENDEAFQRLERAVRGWGDEFTDTLTEITTTGKFSFADMADSIIKDLIRIQIQQRVTEPLIDAGTSFLSSLLPGSVDGGRAAGGPVRAGRRYLVGEDGPEILQMGRQSGEVIPNGAGGGVNVTVHVDQSSGQVRTQGGGNNGQQLGNAIGAAVRTELLKQMRPGGLLQGAA